MSVGTMFFDGPPDAGRYLKEVTPSVPNFAETLFARREGIDDAVIQYILKIEPAFEQLKQAMSQLAGILVLAASGSKSAPGHPMLSLAVQAYHEAQERLGAVKVPRDAKHQHSHLWRASVALKQALDAASVHLRNAGDAEIDQIFHSLDETRAELRFACAALPGLELVALSEGCACHPFPSLQD